MRFEVIISHRAMKDLKNLPEEVNIRIVSTLEQVAEDPIRNVYRLKDSPLFSVHLGEYRIILEIIHRKLLVLVVRAGHRRNNYGRI